MRLKKSLFILVVFILGYILGNIYPTFYILDNEQENLAPEDQETLALDNNSFIELESL